VKLFTRRDDTISHSKYKLLADGFHHRIVFFHAERLKYKLMKMSVLFAL